MHFLRCPIALVRLVLSQSRNARWTRCGVVPHGGKLRVRCQDRVPRNRLRRSPREAGSQAGDADVSPAALSLPEAHTQAPRRPRLAAVFPCLSLGPARRRCPSPARPHPGYIPRAGLSKRHADLCVWPGWHFGCVRDLSTPITFH